MIADYYLISSVDPSLAISGLRLHTRSEKTLRIILY